MKTLIIIVVTQLQSAGPLNTIHNATDYYFSCGKPLAVTILLPWHSAECSSHYAWKKNPWNQVGIKCTLLGNKSQDLYTSTTGIDILFTYQFFKGATT